MDVCERVDDWLDVGVCDEDCVIDSVSEWDSLEVCDILRVSLTLWDMEIDVDCDDDELWDAELVV